MSDDDDDDDDDDDEPKTRSLSQISHFDRKPLLSLKNVHVEHLHCVCFNGSCAIVSLSSSSLSVKSITTFVI